jgi:hypothetical protein
MLLCGVQGVPGDPGEGACRQSPDRDGGQGRHTGRELDNPYHILLFSVADPDPLPFWPLEPGSGKGFVPDPDPGDQNHIESLVTILL